MIIRIFAILPFLVLSACGGSEPEPVAIDYPTTATIDHVDTYHGINVADPYRWLEDDVRESGEVENWVDAQNAVTFEYLDSIEERDIIKKRLTELWDFERFGMPNKEGGRYYYSYNDGLQNQDVIYVQSSLDDEATLLIDPNTWSDDGTIAMSSYYPRPDGRHVAYLVQDGCSDCRTAQVMDVETGKVLDDELEWLKFTGLAWAGDG